MGARAQTGAGSHLRGCEPASQRRQKTSFAPADGRRQSSADLSEPAMLTLYYSPGACSLGPHILIEELGLEAELRRAAIAEGATRTAEFLALNPRGRVPTLEVDGEPVTEGPALMVWLASLRPEAGLLPAAGTLALARALEWLAWMSSTHHVAYAQLWRPERFLGEGADGAALAAPAREIIARQTGEIERRLEGPWLLGSDYGVADAYLLAFYRWAVRIGLPVEGERPRWTAWKDRMLDRPAVQRALEREGLGTDWKPL
jgi:glutathione S-transferase